METLYRKVAVSERLPKDSGFYFIISANGAQKNYWFNGVMFFVDENISVNYWLEEIPDNSHQLEKLEADKAELLEALEDVKKFLNCVQAPATPALRLSLKIKSLIQKHKQ